jgi:hypothetical protein
MVDSESSNSDKQFVANNEKKDIKFRAEWEEGG